MRIAKTTFSLFITLGVPTQLAIGIATPTGMGTWSQSERGLITRLHIL
jgi:hypothetical protein